MLFAAIALLFALTRAEILERLRASPVVQCDGMVQVWADCPSDMRREYQLPIATFVGRTCKDLYRATNRKLKHFERPGIVIHIGSITTNRTDVLVGYDRHADNTEFVRMKIPAPGFADPDRLRIETAKAFHLLIDGKRITDEEAITSLRSAYPELKLIDQYAELEAWLNGAYGTANDEKYLQMMRSVLAPGKVNLRDVLTFASRLYLYPDQYDLPFAGKYDCCSFREAISLAKIDPCIRYAALRKSMLLPVYGGGRGQRMNDCAMAFMNFLMELAKYEKSELELETMLDDAEDKLKGVLE